MDQFEDYLFRNVRAERVKFGTETEFGREKEPLIRHSGRRWRGMTFHQQHVALCKSYNSSLSPLLHHTLLLSSLTTPTHEWVNWTTVFKRITRTMVLMIRNESPLFGWSKLLLRLTCCGLLSALDDVIIHAICLF